VRIAVTKRRLRLTIAAWASLAVPLAAQAQGYPSRPIRSIMTVAGGADVVARLVAQGLSGVLGQPVVVETQSGAGG
jgi:tripartite-type tricarboxylate transporter receptor subunit TctC